MIYKSHGHGNFFFRLCDKVDTTTTMTWSKMSFFESAEAVDITFSTHTNTVGWQGGVGCAIVLLNLKFCAYMYTQFGKDL